MVLRRRNISRRDAQGIARERMKILLDQAAMVFKEDQELARRYVFLARKIGMRNNVRLLREDKLRLCRRCNAYLVAGVTSRVRTHEGRLVVTCLDCGGVRRIPYARKRKGKLNKCAEVKSPLQ